MRRRLIVHFTGEEHELDYLKEAIEQADGYVAFEEDIEDE